MFASASLNVPLSRLWAGLRFKADGLVRRTRVEDPLTDERRNFSGFYPGWRWSTDLRRDRGAFAYGLSISDRAAFRQFRSSEIQRNSNLGPFGTAFVEYRPDGRTKAIFEVENIFDTAGVADRLRFDPDRRSRTSSFREYRFRNSHPRLTLTFARTFGGGTKAGTAVAN